MKGKMLSFSADGEVFSGPVVGFRTVEGAKYARVQFGPHDFGLIPFATAQRLVIGYQCVQLAEAAGQW